jgi:hypothetical protein
MGLSIGFLAPEDKAIGGSHARFTAMSLTAGLPRGPWSGLVPA